MLVVGGGPAGLAAAAELGLRGIECVVLEPRAEVSHLRPRAKTTSVRTMEHLRRWGVADALRAAAPLPVAWSQRVTFCESLSGHRITHFDNAFGLTTTRDDRFAEAGQQVPQPVVEDVLRAHIGRLPGVELRLGHAASTLIQDDDGVTVRVRGQGGAPYDIRAHYVLGCDGAVGVTRDQIGARYVGRSDPRPNFNVVFRAPSFDTQLGPAVQYWVLGATSGLVGRLDLAGTWWAVIPGIEAAYGAAHASELITALLGAPVPHELVASDPWTAHMMIADRFRDRRVFLVGESAHLNPPWGGHGFNTCVGDAVNIAWKIAAVEQGWASPELLDSYEPERRGVVEQTVASAEANMRSLAGELPPDGPAIQLAKRPEFHSLGLVLGYSYGGSPVVEPTADHRDPVDVTNYTPSTEPGARLPHRWLPDGASLYDRLGLGFSLVGPMRAHGPGVATLADLARQKRIPLSLVDSPADQPFLLVRPDQHIAARADDAADLDLDLAIGHRVPGTHAVSTTSSSRVWRLNMRIATIHGRVALIDGTGSGAVDVETASGGRFGPEPAGVYERWTEFLAWAGSTPLSPAEAFEPEALGSPSPNPRQVFGIGLNYSAHAAEAGLRPPRHLAAGLHEVPDLPHRTVRRHRAAAGRSVDWEVELVVVIGPVARMWPRRTRLASRRRPDGRPGRLRAHRAVAPPPPQFSLGKSYPGFGPIGPCLVTPDELDDPDDLELGCSVNDEQMQQSRTSDMVFSVSALIDELSADPAAAARRRHLHRHPVRHRRRAASRRGCLAPGDVLTSDIEGIGDMRNRFVAGSPRVGAK